MGAMLQCLDVKDVDAEYLECSGCVSTGSTQRCIQRLWRHIVLTNPLMITLPALTKYNCSFLLRTQYLHLFIMYSR
jgi:hypothetical protein